MTLELEIDVPESRQVTLTLPPEVPVGKATVSVSVGKPMEPTPFVPHPSFVQELEAFNRMLPELLKTHRGQFVAIYQDQVVGAGPNKLAVAHEAYEKYGAVNVLVRFVAEEQPVRRIAGPRLVRPEGRPYVAPVLEHQLIERFSGFREIGPVLRLPPEAELAAPQVVISTPVS